MGSPDPDPDETPGLQPGGGVWPGDTPPAAESTANAHYQRPAADDRKLSMVLMIVLGVVVALIVIGLVWKGLTLII